MQAMAFFITKLAMREQMISLFQPASEQFNLAFSCIYQFTASVDRLAFTEKETEAIKWGLKIYLKSLNYLMNFRLRN